MKLPPRFHYDDAADEQRRGRHEAAVRRLGTREPECVRSDCNETDPFALTGAYPEILCYEHRQSADGKNPVEADHAAGHNNDATVFAVPGNDHRVLSDLQNDWPLETLRNPHRDPLLRIAAILRRWVDLMWLFIERLMGWIPTALEQLSRILTQRHGAFWWHDLGWAVS